MRPLGVAFMDIDFLIAHLPPTIPQRHVEKLVRLVFRAAGVTGAWAVTLLPSDRQSRWDLGINGPSGRQFESFTAQDAGLPTEVAEHVRRLLGRPVRG